MSNARKTDHFVLGTPADLPEGQLPSNKDVINYIRLIYTSPGKVRGNTMTLFKSAAKKIIAIWVSESIPVIREQSVCNKVATCYKKYQMLNKTMAQRRDPKKGQMNVKFFEKLFDIAVCRCENQRSCKCPPEKRVPPTKVKFLLDQRRPRKIFDGPATATPKRQRQQQKREPQAPSPQASRPSSEPGPSGLQNPRSDSPPNGSCSGAADTDDLDMQCTEEDDARHETPHGNPDQFVNTALAAERFGVPYHVVCAIVNGFQRDIGRISETDKKGVVDSSKILCARQRVRDALASVAEEHGSIQALYFDGGQYESPIGKPTIRREEHVAVVAEPGSKYLTYFTPESGKTIRQAGQLLNIATDCDADVRALGCNGTAGNTDRHSGVCRLFELSQEPPRAVHWFVCQLDANDLLLRAVLHYLDRLPTGSGSSGPLVETASGEVHRLGVTAFRAVPGPLPDLSDQQVAELSSDQQILYRLARGVNDGKLLDDSDAHGEIGPVEDDRCLTAAVAARLLRVYIGSPSPTTELTELVEFLMGHYIPMWLHIRANSTCSSGAPNVMRSIELLRKLSSGLHDVIRKVVQSNAYWAHPESVLLAMVADPDAAVRARAVDIIQRCRQQPQEEVRPFKLPNVNFAATHYTELLDWEKELVTEPPLTADLTDSELQDICGQPLRIAAFPVHTEGAKRAVRVVHQADRAVFGEERRHEWVRSRLSHK